MTSNLNIDSERRLTYDELEAMYFAQCKATDEFADKARTKSDPVLKERIAELERDLAEMNKRYTDALARTPADPESGELAKLREALQELYEMTSRYAISDADYGIVCNAAAVLALPQSMGKGE